MRRVVIVVLVLLGLLVVLDRVAVLAADRVVANRITTEQGLSQRPDVSIGGFPFLTQALAGHYDSVTLRMHDLQRTGVNVHLLTVHLSGVHVPLGAVVHGHVSSVPVDRATATLLLTYDDLNTFLGTRHIVLGDGGNGEIKVSATATVAGQTLSADGRARIQVRDGDLMLTVGPGIDVTIPLGGLPFRIELVGAKATKSGVEVTATASGLVLHPHE